MLLKFKIIMIINLKRIFYVLFFAIKQNKILFVATVGKLRHHYKYGDYSQVVEMETLAELDLPFAAEWGKEECGKTTLEQTTKSTK